MEKLHEKISSCKEDRLDELLETLTPKLLETILAKPTDVEFRLKPGSEWVPVYYKWKYICSIAKEQYKWFADEDNEAIQYLLDLDEYGGDVDEMNYDKQYE